MPRESDALDKNDLDTILKVNAKSIELLNETSDQYEEVIRQTSGIKESVASTDKVIREEVKTDLKQLTLEISTIKLELKDLNKGQTKILILLSSGIINLIITLISLFYLKH